MNVASFLFSLLARQLGARLELDGAALLAERAALAAGNFIPQAGRTLRGHGRLVRARDGWLAVNLPRPEDLESLPALTGGAVDDAGGLGAWAAGVPAAHILEQARLLSLPVAAVPHPGPRPRPGGVPAPPPDPWVSHDLGPVRRRPDGPLQVLDLTGLWAGPLCTSLLASLGAEVIRVSGSQRRETPSPHDAAFNELLSAGVQRLQLDLAGPRLQELLDAADIVVTSSRPGALHRLGLRTRGGVTWIRITAHGAEGADAGRVGFGDDAAAAAGAVAYTPDGPAFAADALADPVTGLLAAVAAAGTIAAGRSALIDLSLRRSAAWALGFRPLGGGDFSPAAAQWPAANPRARSAVPA